MKADIKELDHWYRNELGELISSRSEPHITKQELIKIVERKLMIGRFRPGFIARVEKNTNDQVVECSKEAFSLLGEGGIDNIKKAIKKLQELFGVGLATTTAILSLVGDVPYFSDAIAGLALKRPPKYLFKEYDSVYKYCLEKQIKLPGLSLNEIQDAIFVKHSLDKEARKVESYQESLVQKKANRLQ